MKDVPGKHPFNGNGKKARGREVTARIIVAENCDWSSQKLSISVIVTTVVFVGAKNV